MSTVGLFPQSTSVQTKALVFPQLASGSMPAPMHIPDRFLSIPVALVMWVVAVIIVSYALLRVNRDLDDRRVPLMGVLAATIFAGQMLNFSVSGGTSGHLVGGALAAIVLGPWPAVLVMTCVVSIQALLFQDGGLLALGANIINMGLVSVTVAYAVYLTVRRLTRGKSWGMLVGGFAAGWLSIVIAALLCALQLAISGTSPANVAVPAMGGIHMLIGIGEGLITAGALALLYTARPDLLAANKTQVAGDAKMWIAGPAFAVLLALMVLGSRH